MKKKIFLSITITSLLFVFITILSLTWISYQSQILSTKKEIKELATTLVEKYNQRDLNPSSIILPSNIRFSLINSSGIVLYDSHLESDVLDNHSTRPEFISAMFQGEGESQRLSTTLQKTTYYFAMRLDNNQVIRLSFTISSIFTQLFSSLKLMMLSLIFIVAINLVTSRLLSKFILSPIYNLDLDHPLTNKTYPELDSLLARIQDHNQLRKEFTSNVSHELKTPLTSIQGYAEIMANNLQGDKTQDFSDRILQESKRLLFLIEDILKLSKLDEGTIDLDRSLLDYPTLIQSVCSSLIPVAQKHQITIHTNCNPATNYGVSVIVYEIIYNLVLNAIKYNSSQGNVWVSCHENEEFVILEVKDDGIGIPLEDQPRIFERFFRSDKSRSSLTEGTGLGLAIVKHGVDFHQGTIQLKSSLNDGTSFLLHLPKTNTHHPNDKKHPF